MNINEEIERIIEKYNLDRYYPAYRSSVLAANYIKEFIGKLSDAGKSVCFICTRWEVKRMLEKWGSGNEDISIIKIAEVEELYHYTMKLQNQDEIYIVSFDKAIEILHFLWRNGFEATSVYDILANNDIYAQMEICDFFCPIKLSDELNVTRIYETDETIGTTQPLYEYYYQRKRLEHSRSEEDKNRITKKLFFLSVCMKNFVEAERLLQTMPNEKEYHRCWQEIVCLFDNIKREICNKGNKSIIIYWLDALGYENADKLDYLKEQQKHSAIFENAYTTTPYTRPTFNAMFREMLNIDDGGYKSRYIGEENSSLLKKIYESGYCFSMISGDTEEIDVKYTFNSRSNHQRLTACSELFWDMLEQIVRDDRPTIYLPHVLAEIHPPCLNVRRDCFEMTYEKNTEVMEGTLEEINVQLRFYDSLLGKGIYRIYMSDHGTREIYDRMHVIFQVYYSNWKPKKIDKLFCYLDFHEIIESLINGKEIDENLWEREYVPIQDVDFYNCKFLTKRLKKIGLDSLPFITAYRGVATKEYLYIRFKTGEELLRRWKDGEYIPIIGMSSAEKDTELLADLREKAGEFPGFLDTDRQFEYAKNTYKLYQALKKTVKEAADLLDKKLELYGDGSVIICSDAYQLRQLLAVINEKSKNKIGGGVLTDITENTRNDFGFPLFSTKDALPDYAKAIFCAFNGQQNNGRIKNVIMHSEIEAVDIYQYWKEKGYDFPQEFWYGLRSDREQIIADMEYACKRMGNEISVFVELQRIIGNYNVKDIPKQNSGLFHDLEREAPYFYREINTEIDLKTYIDSVYDNVKGMLLCLSKDLNKMFESYSDESIVLRPGGNHTMQFCGLLNTESRKKIGGIIDGFAQCQCKDLGYKIYKTGEALPKNIKVVILSTYINADELRENTKRLYSDLEVIDIYSLWEKQGYHFWKDFWFGTKADWNV